MFPFIFIFLLLIQPIRAVLDECLTYREFFEQEEILKCVIIEGALDTREWISAGGTVLSVEPEKFYATRPFGNGYEYIRPCQLSANCHIHITVSIKVERADSRGQLSRIYEDDTTIPTPEDLKRRRRRKRKTRYPTPFPTKRRTVIPTLSPTKKSECPNGCISADGAVCYICGRPSYPSSLPSCGEPPCNLLVEQTVTVLYSPSLLASSSSAELDIFAQLAVTQSNQIYRSSQIPIKLTLKGTAVSSFDESGDSYTDLLALRSAGPPPGGANMAVLLVRNLGSCGRAFLDCTAYGPGRNCGLAVVRAACAVGYYSFTHEIGHIQGADHNYAFRSTPTSRFTYGYGYSMDPSKTIDGGSYRTVMAYDSGMETRIPYFSNPDVQYQGAPTGVEDEADNARVLRGTRLAVAAL